MALIVLPANSQNVHGPARLSKTSSNVLLSWTGVGTLQSSPVAVGGWQDVLEASSPHGILTTNTRQFFRVISRWGTRANLIEANSEMGVAELDGKIYVLGGYPASRVTVNTVQVYDSVSNTWRLGAPLLLGVNHPMPAVANGKVYVIGGQTDTGSAYVNNVQEFDPVTSNWTYRAVMPTARSAGTAVVIGDRIYVAGGRPPRGNDFAVYHATSNTWQILPNLPTQRNHIAACAIDGKIYVVGGRLAAGFQSAMTNILEVFDPVLNQWSTRVPMPTARGGINGIAANGNFFVFGGEGPNGVFDEMEMYVPAQNRWYRLEPLPIAVHGVTGSALVNGWIHLPGGGTSTGGSSGAVLHQVFSVDGIVP
ncbi:MAG TPA: kelch repeat-containing protein [Verrucomicrobiae bacterium]|nr:kelch repeat-containing protein [Verrucomicrobiae bacterium]